MHLGNPGIAGDKTENLLIVVATLAAVRLGLRSGGGGSTSRRGWIPVLSFYRRDAAVVLG